MHVKALLNITMLRLLLVLLLLTNAALAQTWQWATNVGSAPQGQTIPHKTIVAANGDVYVLGEYQDVARFGTDTLAPYGMTDIFLAKYSATGQMLWARRMGGSAAETAVGLGTDGAGSAYLAFNFTGSVQVGGIRYNTRGLGDCIVTKVDASGQFQWVRKIGSSDHDVMGNITTDALGNTYVVGYNDDIDSANCFSAGGIEDTYVAKIGPNGECLWAVRGGTDDEVADNKYGIALNPDGTRLVVTSAFQERGYFGNMVLVGDSGAGYSQVFVAMLNTTDGNWLWAKQAGGSSQDMATTAVLDVNGNTTIGGHFGSDVMRFGPSIQINSAGGGMQYPSSYVARLDSLGNFIWASVLTGNGLTGITDVELTGDGDAYAAGYAQSVVYAGTDTVLSGPNSLNIAFLARISGFDGTWQWAIPANEHGSILSRKIDMAVAGVGQVFYADHYADSASFGPIRLAGPPLSTGLHEQGYLTHLSDFMPLLNSVSPTSGGTGTNVTLMGARMGQTTKVTFNGMPAPFTIISPTELRVTVPQGATTGVIQVTTADGRANSPILFEVTGPTAVGATLSTAEGIAPNPAHGSVKVLIKSSRFPQMLLLTDALGRVVRRWQVSANETQTEVTLDGLKPGPYSLRSGEHVYKLTIE